MPPGSTSVLSIGRKGSPQDTIKLFGWQISPGTAMTLMKVSRHNKGCERYGSVEAYGVVPGFYACTLQCIRPLPMRPDPACLALCMLICDSERVIT